jgi:DNA helicase IV
MTFRLRPTKARRKLRSLVDVTLDPAQRAAVQRPAGDALLVVGDAGHGKTTVALHRMAHLWRSSGKTLRAAVIVPSEGLARLLQPMLRRLGVDLEVHTFDGWASSQARRAFRRLPREADSTPPSVMTLKRHPALGAAIETIARTPPRLVDEEVDAPVTRTNARVSRGDLQHLFGDRLLLERVASQAGLSERHVQDTLAHTRAQFRTSSAEEWAHVTDRQRLVAVDGRALDDGTPHATAGTIDVEDYAVLVELDRLRASALSAQPAVVPRYDLLMLDEAQELAPLELAWIGRTLAPHGTLVVAGDAQQRTDPTSTFVGWKEVMRELGREDHARVALDIGYRCPPEVVRLAKSVLTPAAAPRGAVVHRFETERARDVWAARALREVLRRDRRGSAAVLCRSPLTARRLASSLPSQECPARLVFDGRFLGRGVQVTTVNEVKGLEFDYVLVPDADAGEYAADDAARRALYVAVTRARHQVLLACVGEPSPLLRPPEPFKRRGAPYRPGAARVR